MSKTEQFSIPPKVAPFIRKLSHSETNIKKLMKETKEQITKIDKLLHFLDETHTFDSKSTCSPPVRAKSSSHFQISSTEQNQDFFITYAQHKLKKIKKKISTLRLQSTSNACIDLSIILYTFENAIRINQPLLFLEDKFNESVGASFESNKKYQELSFKSVALSNFIERKKMIEAKTKIKSEMDELIFGVADLNDPQLHYTPMSPFDSYLMKYVDLNEIDQLAHYVVLSRFPSKQKDAKERFVPGFKLLLMKICNDFNVPSGDKVSVVRCSLLRLISSRAFIMRPKTKPFQPSCSFIKGMENIRRQTPRELQIPPEFFSSMKKVENFLDIPIQQCIPQLPGTSRVLRLYNSLSFESCPLDFGYCLSNIGHEIESMEGSHTPLAFDPFFAMYVALFSIGAPPNAEELQDFTKTFDLFDMPQMFVQACMTFCAAVEYFKNCGQEKVES